MRISEIIDRLIQVELRHLSLGNSDPCNDPSVCAPSQLVPVIVSGINALYARFPLRENRVHLLLDEEMDRYVIRADYAISVTDGEGTTYIDDTIYDTLDQTVYKIVSVKDENEEELLTKRPVKNRVRLLDYRTLLVPRELTENNEKLLISYRANHPDINITLAISTPEAVEVDLPYSFMDAIAFYSASRFIHPMVAGEFHEGNNYASKYEQECIRLEMNGHEVTWENTDDKFHMNGWV